MSAAWIPSVRTASALVAGALLLGMAPVDPTPELGTAAVTPGSGPVSVAVVMPLTVPPTTSGLLDADALTTYTQENGLLDRQLDAVAGSGAAIGLDPMITASIRVLGTAAPESALDFLSRLRALPNEVFLLGYADADPALAAVAGIEQQLSPLGFGFAIDPANFGPAQSPTPTPTTTSGPTATPGPDATTPPDDGTPDDGPPALPTTEDLLAWPTTLPSIAWPAEGTLTEDGLAGLARQGYADTVIAGTNASATSTALVDLGDIDGLVVDDSLTTAVRTAVYAPTETEYAAATVTLAAALRAEAIKAPGRTLVATLDRRWPFGTPRLDAVLATIEGQASSQLVSLSDVLAGPKGNATLVDPSGDDTERATTLSELADAADTEARYLTIADRPGVLTEPRRLALLGLSAVGWRIDDVGWTAATTEQRIDAESTLDAVQITENTDQLVLSDISSLRLHVSNALPVPVTVYVTVSPLRPLLHVEDTSVELDIEPDSTATASVPVESISNGEVSIRTELRAANGQAIGDTRFLKVILQAGWETAGTLIVAALVLVIFGGGLIRVFLRRRRDAAAESASAESASADAAPADD